MAARLRIWQDRSAPALYALARMNGLAGSIPACLYSSSSPRSLTSVFWPDRAGSIRSRSPLAGGSGVFGLAATASSVTDAGSGDSSPAWTEGSVFFGVELAEPTEWRGEKRERANRTERTGSNAGRGRGDRRNWSAGWRKNKREDLFAKWSVRHFFGIKGSSKFARALHREKQKINCYSKLFFFVTHSTKVASFSPIYEKYD
jgi:hypothetical protein